MTILRSIFLLATTLMTNVGTIGQVRVTWDELAQVSFNKEVDESFGMEILMARFSEDVLSLDSQEVTITGFVIPLNALGTSYVLSRFPNANCFFCGGAGPETIVELKLAPSHLRRYATDTYATFTGRLTLHESNLSSFNYVLVDARRIE